MYLYRYLTFWIRNHVRLPRPVKTVARYIQRKIFRRNYSKFKSHCHTYTTFMSHAQNITHQRLRFLIMLSWSRRSYRSITTKSLRTFRQRKYTVSTESIIFHFHGQISPTCSKRIIKTSLRKNILIFYLDHRFHISGITFTPTGIIMKSNKINTILLTFVQIIPIVFQIPARRT